MKLNPHHHNALGLACADLTAQVKHFVFPRQVQSLVRKPRPSYALT